ncbi:DUF393 domain-containing protein [Aquimarina sp. ERC-38]|uniref:thiol-disulfide oxidoreductase DCC family protein n=1 Tax=Aquimarina sp. ERC-38 TaxID=2949996 RepID=UPI002247AF6D|nr:DCC1-like thiol-disulfide oxidoreductase family protein [Aquimarina sp. ERC-38]UZO82687.1 DUF393 domain-containing protein [Aquimarina sp. ERC-38]
MCNGAIQFIIARDKNRIFRYASLQSDMGKEFLSKRNIDPKVLDSIILVHPDQAYYVKSTAALKIAKELSGLYPLLSSFLILPKFIRDGIYDIIAANRYKWFGKKTECMIPTPDQRSLFID